MRKFCTALILGLGMFSTLVYALPSWVIPSPVTIAVQIGQWILSSDSNQEVFYIRVQSKGSTESEARTEAFRLAVDQAVGSLLVSETVVQNDKVDRHEIINYSSGYVHDFKYVNIHRSQNEVILQVDVYVSKSKIAERITIQGETQGDLQGGRIAEAFKSLQQEQKTGDQVLTAVLTDYPHKAIEVKNIQVEYSNPNRQPTLTISYSVQWIDKYIVSLKEALSNTMFAVHHTQLGENGVNFYNSKCIFSCYEAYKTDSKRFEVFINGVARDAEPMTMITLFDTHKREVTKQCWMFSRGLNLLTYYSNNTFQINEKEVTAHKITFNLAHLDISRLDTVDVKIVSRKNCYN